ncbi:hypothetical protein DFH06DRAFT_602377 [Mycena polygramma]|nr:hypothetical protein DFH06DRAFT_602377 [Mycena polygramma]
MPMESTFRSAFAAFHMDIRLWRRRHLNPSATARRCWSEAARRSCGPARRCLHVVRANVELHARHGAGVRPIILVILAPLIAAGLYPDPEARHYRFHSRRADTLASVGAGSGARGECRQESLLYSSGNRYAEPLARAMYMHVAMYFRRYRLADDTALHGRAAKVEWDG